MNCDTITSLCCAVCAYAHGNLELTAVSSIAMPDNVSLIWNTLSALPISAVLTTGSLSAYQMNVSNFVTTVFPYVSAL